MSFRPCWPCTIIHQCKQMCFYPHRRNTSLPLRHPLLISHDRCLLSCPDGALHTDFPQTSGLNQVFIFRPRHFFKCHSIQKFVLLTRKSESRKCFWPYGIALVFYILYLNGCGIAPLKNCWTEKNFHSHFVGLLRVSICFIGLIFFTYLTYLNLSVCLAITYYW